MNEENKLRTIIFENSVELNSTPDLDVLVDKMGDARIVLLGEASHGTHEYYTLRSQISKKLIKDKGFSFIAVEGDWPDCYRLNRYVKNYNETESSAYNVLQAFNRWPTWMWANWEIVALAEWMKKHNQTMSADKKAGFYGLDVYSLWESLESIINYLNENDLPTRDTALKAIECFEPYGDREGSSYARATLIIPETCEKAVVQLLSEVRNKMAGYNSDPEAVLNAEQNAVVGVNAEKYYRAMVRRGAESWNIRDRHMTDTLNRLLNFHGKKSKAIVWEHNTHIGDARATDMADRNMINVGQLLKEQYSKDEVFSVGFGSYKGKVIAGREWGDVMRIINVPEAVSGSWEHLLHKLGKKNRIVFMTDSMKKVLGNKKIGHRAIGVVYDPHYEHYGNYVPSNMPERYDSFIYLEETNPLHALHLHPAGHQIPETFPFGV